MRRIIPTLLIGVLSLTLQSTLLTYFPVQRIRPDLVLILTLYLALSYPPISGGILAFFMGYLMDLFSGNTLGLYTFTRPLIFYGAQFFKGHFYLEGFSSQFLFVSIFSLMEGFLVLLLLTALNPNPSHNLHPLLFTYLLPQSIFSGLITPVLFLLFNKGFLYLSPQARTGVRERGSI
jgi:rod shape-determining protein MreD